MTIESDLRGAWETWQDNRISSLKSPKGNLALVLTEWPFGGELPDLQDLISTHPTSVTYTEIERKNFAGEVIANGYRLWDANSPANQGFEKIESFDFDSNWIIEGLITRYDESKAVAFEHIRDHGGSRDLAVPAEIEIVIDEYVYHLQPFDNDGQMLLVFGDLTNGSETYGGGRFLKVLQEPGSDKAILDFNRAFVPPCGFSEHFNCPLPPVQNRIKSSVRAGEKRPIFKASNI